MNYVLAPSVPKLLDLPASMPLDGAISVELADGVPIFRASQTVQQRVELLLEKQRAETLSDTEHREMSRYEEIDDYLSFLNRIVRNIQTASEQPG